MQSASTNSEQNLVTRQIILQAAYEEIYARGFQAASIAKILSTTDVTKGALYHYFPTKLDLGYAVVDELLAEQIQARWIEPLLIADDPISALKEIIIAAGQEISEEDIQCGCPLNNLAQEMSPVDEGFRLRVEAVYKMWRVGTEEAFKQGQRHGLVKQNVDPKNIAIMLVASLEGCIGMAKSAQSKNILYQCGQSIIDYLDGLRG
ncbi:MAG: TetR/AcrR family transcriptional regulator [Gammaproteobacteria bacterium]|nr:TetR/AcrR family transcriptional regulator [Gammaproteobacteria bacterium]